MSSADTTTEPEFIGPPKQEESEGTSFTEIAIVYMISQAVIGLIMLIWAWYRTREFRRVDADRDAFFQACCRRDAKDWAFWKFMFGAMLTMPSRMILLFFDGVFLVLAVS